MVSVLDSGAVGPGFKSQLSLSGNSRRQTVQTHRDCSPSSEIGSSPLKGCEGNYRSGGK